MNAKKIKEVLERHRDHIALQRWGNPFSTEKECCVLGWCLVDAGFDYEDVANITGGAGALWLDPEQFRNGVRFREVLTEEYGLSEHEASLLTQVNDNSLALDVMLERVALPVDWAGSVRLREDPASRLDRFFDLYCDLKPEDC